MSTEHETPKNEKIPQPTELISPAAQGFINAAIASAVKEAISGVFASLKPTLEAVSLTPEKLGAALREANRPFDTPEKIAAKLREERENLQSREQDAEMRRQQRERQENCAHQDRNGKSAINLVHNWPDHPVRGICPLCHLLIEPACWKIGSALSHPERKDHAYIQPEHPKYFLVRQLESMSGWLIVAGLGLLTFGHALVGLLS